MVSLPMMEVHHISSAVNSSTSEFSAASSLIDLTKFSLFFEHTIWRWVACHLDVDTDPCKDQMDLPSGLKSDYHILRFLNCTTVGLRTTKETRDFDKFLRF